MLHWMRLAGNVGLFRLLKQKHICVWLKFDHNK